MTFRLTKPHREQVDALVAAGFAVEPLRWGKGDHLIVRVELDDGAGAGTVTIGGSPSDRRAVKNLVRCARQACRVA